MYRSGEVFRTQAPAGIKRLNKERDRDPTGDNRRQQTHEKAASHATEGCMPPIFKLVLNQADDMRILDSTSHYKKGAIVNSVNRQLHLVVGLLQKI